MSRPKVHILIIRLGQAYTVGKIRTKSFFLTFLLMKYDLFLIYLADFVVCLGDSRIRLGDFVKNVYEEQMVKNNTYPN